MIMGKSNNAYPFLFVMDKKQNSGAFLNFWKKLKKLKTRY